MGSRKKAGKPGNEQAEPEENPQPGAQKSGKTLFKSYQKNQKEATSEYSPVNGALI
jgi:hypothetical protein